MIRRRSSVVLVAGIMALGLPAQAIGADAYAVGDGSHTTRVAVDARTGEALIITDEGQCGRTTVVQRSQNEDGIADFGITVELSYVVDKDCNVQIVGSSLTPSSQTRSLMAVLPELKGASLNGGLMGATVYGNVVHGSQTLQDIINIDIAKYQYGHDRVWHNIGYSYFKSGDNRWMRSSTSMSWNHRSGPPVSDGFDSAWRHYAAYADGHASFHSDFLWCNLQPGQNFTLYTTLKSVWQGSYDGSSDLSGQVGV